MFCPNCGNQMKDGTEFCSNCGWSKESNASKKGVLKIPKIPKVVLKLVFAVLGIVILAIIIYNVPKPKGKVYEFSDIRKVKPVTKYWKNSVVDNFDTVIFGSYPQSDASGNAKEPIEWIVLDQQDNKTLLLSKYILDYKCYNNEEIDVWWNISSLRNWLNNDFYNSAFSSDEQNKISWATVDLTDHTFSATIQDKIFCLNVEEVRKYFGNGRRYTSGLNNEYRNYDIGKKVATKATPYVQNMEYGNWKKKFAFLDEYGCFWLRSHPAYEDNKNAIYVDWTGRISLFGDDVDFMSGVRPALWVEN